VPPGRPTAKGGAAGKTPRDAASDYRAKGTREAESVSRRLAAALGPPTAGDPTSGLMLVVDGPGGPRAQQALEASLAAVGLPDAYLTWAGTGLLMEQILSAEPGALVAVGPRSAEEIDALEYPLARRRFSEAPEGEWFVWTRGAVGLLLPAVHPALSDDTAKRRFWSAFLRLRDLLDGSP
jgi:hypothetical protein